MYNLKSLSIPTLLVSGKLITDDTGSHLNLDFIWLTDINIPNICLFYNPENGFTFIYSSRLNINLKQKIVSKVGKKIMFSSLTEFNKLVSSFSQKIHTLPNTDVSKIKINIENLETSHLELRCYQGRSIKHKKEIVRVKKAALEVSLGIMKLWKSLVKMRSKTTMTLVRFLKKNISLDEEAYPIICSTKHNIPILHYPRYDSQISNDSLILLDIGFKFDNYCCDITRCFPKNGKFSTEQKIIYELVLNCQELILQKIKANIKFEDLENIAYLTLFEGLENIGFFMPHTLTSSQKIKWIAENMMYHSLGHPVGLHVHDVSKYDILMPNMIYAIEPALYFSAKLHLQSLVNQEVLKKYKDIGGIRIEDTILITEIGCQILNKINGKQILPKKIKDIEKIMNH